MKKNKIVKISLRASKNISKRHLSNLTKVPKNELVPIYRNNKLTCNKLIFLTWPQHFSKEKIVEPI